MNEYPQMVKVISGDYQGAYGLIVSVNGEHGNVLLSTGDSIQIPISMLEAN